MVNNTIDYQQQQPKSNMSDLLPLLVATSVRDKVLLDAKDELDNLQKRVEVATSIEIVHDATGEESDDKIVVYASEPFDKGTYDEIFWKVSFSNDNHLVCKLSDLQHCHICVGGGFTIFDFASSDYEAYLDKIIDGGDDDGGDVEIRVSCVRPFNLWVTLGIQNLPEAADHRSWEHFVGEPFDLEWFTTLRPMEYPEAQVRFKSVRFEASSIRGPLQRLLPPRRRKEPI